MKLIIDIPEDMFKSITKWKKPNDDTRLTLWLLLKNGIPIDKIKSEIETDLSYFCFDDWGNETTEWKEVKAIIDKYKAESEVQDADSD